MLQRNPQQARSASRPAPLKRVIRTVLAVAVTLVVLFTATSGAVVMHAAWLDWWAPPAQEADVIVVLGGGVHRDGSPGPDTRRRVEHAISLYDRGIAGRMHFTGGHRNPELPGLGTGMAQVAIAAGVDPARISTEDNSRSTLQNALLSREMLPPERAGRILLVSDGYHLGRAWMSFRFAGYRPIALSASSALGNGEPIVKMRRVAREAAAWWFNAARFSLWAGMNALGYDEPAESPLLAGPVSATGQGVRA